MKCEHVFTVTGWKLIGGTTRAVDFMCCKCLKAPELEKGDKTVEEKPENEHREKSKKSAGKAV